MLGLVYPLRTLGSEGRGCLAGMNMQIFYLVVLAFSILSGSVASSAPLFLETELKLVSRALGGPGFDVGNEGLKQIQEAKQAWYRNLSGKKYFVEQTEREVREDLAHHNLWWQRRLTYESTEASIERVRSLEAAFRDELRDELPNFKEFIQFLTPNSPVLESLENANRKLESHLGSLKPLAPAELARSKQQFQDELKKANSSLIASLADQLRRFRHAQAMSADVRSLTRSRFMVELPDEVFDPSCSLVFPKIDRRSVGSTFFSRVLGEGGPRSISIYDEDIVKVVVSSPGEPANRGPLRITCVERWKWDVFNDKWEFDRDSRTLTIRYDTTKSKCGPEASQRECLTLVVRPVREYLQALSFFAAHAPAARGGSRW